MTEELYVLRNGQYVQVRDDGEKYKAVDSPDVPLPEGWHYVVKGEFDHVDIRERFRSLVTSRMADTN